MTHQAAGCYFAVCSFLEGRGVDNVEVLAFDPDAGKLTLRLTDPAAGTAKTFGYTIRGAEGGWAITNAYEIPS